MQITLLDCYALTDTGYQHKQLLTYELIQLAKGTLASLSNTKPYLIFNDGSLITGYAYSDAYELTQYYLNLPEDPRMLKYFFDEQRELHKQAELLRLL